METVDSFGYCRLCGSPVEQCEYEPLIDPHIDEPETPEAMAEIRQAFADSMRKITGQLDAATFGLSNCTTSSEQSGIALTLADLERTYQSVMQGMDAPGSFLPFSRPCTPGQPLFPAFGGAPEWPMFPPGVAFHVLTDPYLGECVTPVPPAMRPGPYLQRRIKRWRRQHPSYMKGAGIFYRIGDTYLCHPDDFDKLYRAFNEVHPVDKGDEHV